MKSVFAIFGLLFGFAGIKLMQAPPDVKLGLMVTVGVMALGSMVVGLIMAKATQRKFDVDGDGAGIFAFTGLALWIFPIFGFVQSSIVWEWSKQTSKRQLRYQVLSMLAGIAATISAMVGAIASVEEQTGLNITFGI